MKLINRKNLMSAACTLAVAAVLSGPVNAALLVDRGLPTTNLNLTTANRSNVAWTDGGQTTAAPTPRDYYVEGDTFANTSSSAWLINTIRIWTVGSFTPGSLTLLGEPTSSTPGALSIISSSFTPTATTYQGGASYVNGAGVSSALTQIDFAVNLLINPGEQFVYFLNGLGGTYVIPFMSASNALLSGSPQQQADGLIWEARLVGGAGTSVGSFSTLNNGWDKVSDFNVQVFGTAVPEPGSVALVGLGLLGVALARRRKT